MTLLKSAMNAAGFSSNDSLARSLCDRYPDVNWPAPRALAVKIGEIDRGRTGWWLKRPEFVGHLGEALSCAPQDLGLHLDSPRADRFHFEDFPELPPLDLRTEKPCELGYLHRGDRDSTEDLKPWLGEPLLGGLARALPSDVTWLHFPSGTGRSLFWERLRSRTAYECVSKRTVADASERLRQPKPVCLEVTDRGGERDVMALAKRHPECAVLVCAPFLPYSRTDATGNEYLSWKYRSAQADQRAQLALTNPQVSDAFGLIGVYEWRLFTDWRARLLRWIDKRLAAHPDTSFDPQQLEVWIASFADRDLFDRPRDLVAICRFAHRFGCRKLPPATDRNVGAKLLDLLYEEFTGAEKVQFRGLVLDWFGAGHLPWDQWIDGGTWRTFVTRPDGGEAAHLLDAMVSEADPGKRQQFADRMRDALRDNDRKGLVDSPFVLQNEQGEMLLAPRFLAHLVVRDRLCGLMARGNFSEWGGHCFDENRHRLILQSLKLMTTAELEGIAAGINLSAHDAASIGAAEALFCAIARQDPRPASIPGALARIGESVLSRLTQTSAYEPRPWSAAGCDGSGWLSVCWHWSLTASRPQVDLPSSWSAHFPGWIGRHEEVDLDDPPYVHLDDVALDDLPASDRLMLADTRKVARCLSDIPSLATPLFAAAVIAEGVPRGWDVGHDWWKVLLEWRWAEEQLARYLAETDAPLTPWLVSLIRAVIAARECEIKERVAKDVKDDRYGLSLLDLFSLRSTPLKEALLSRSNPADLLDALDRSALNWMFSIFETLPVNYQEEILYRYRISPDIERPLWIDIVAKLTPDLVEAVVPWTSLPPFDGVMAAAWLWRNTERVTELLSDPHTTIDALRNLVNSCPSEPRAALEAALQTIERKTDLFTMDRAVDWAVELLPCSGPLAPKLLAFIARMNSAGTNA